MKAQKGSRPRLGMEALMWVSNSERPLHTTELCHALGVRIGSSDLDVENVPTIRTLLACSLGLLTIEASSSTVRLVHFSLQEYLSDNPSLFQSPHSMIAEVCLTYLNFRCVRELSPTLNLALATAPLVGYASSCWGGHVKRAGIVAPLVMKLLLEFEQHISSQLLLLRYYEDESFCELDLCKRRCFEGFTGLHGAAFFGILEIFATLLVTKEWDINATDTGGRTALAWAAVGGHEDVVAMILQRKGVEADTADTGHGLTPLLLAVVCGHEGVVKLLLERKDVNPNTADTKHGITPLISAAVDGNEGIVKLLLERKDVNPNTAEPEHGVTPLLFAVENRDRAIVKLLLEREDVNPNTAGPKHGFTPLLFAVENGDGGIVKLLLEREDVNPNTAGTENGVTPLLLAVVNENEGMAKLLLEREDINPNLADTKYGQTPLAWTAGNGHEGVAKLLLEREDINPNTTAPNMVEHHSDYLLFSFSLLFSRCHQSLLIKLFYH